MAIEPAGVEADVHAGCEEHRADPQACSRGFRRLHESGELSGVGRGEVGVVERAAIAEHQSLPCRVAHADSGPVFRQVAGDFGGLEPREAQVDDLPERLTVVTAKPDVAAHVQIHVEGRLECEPPAVERRGERRQLGLQRPSQLTGCVDLGLDFGAAVRGRWRLGVGHRGIIAETTSHDVERSAG